MSDVPHDHDGIEKPILPSEREARREEAACAIGAMLLKLQFEQGLLELEDAAHGAMIGIGEVLAQLEGGTAYFVDLCDHFGNIAKTLRNRPPTSRGLQ